MAIKKEGVDGICAFDIKQIGEGKYDFKGFIKNQPLAEFKILKATLCRIAPFIDSLKKVEKQEEEKVEDPWILPFEKIPCDFPIINDKSAFDVHDNPENDTIEKLGFTPKNYMKWIKRE